MGFLLQFLLFIPIAGGKHNCLSAQSTYEQGKVHLKIDKIKVGMPNLAGKEQLSIHLFSRRTRPSRLSTEN